MDEMRALLDSLMGADRNSLQQTHKKSFKDPDVCRWYILNFCPHALFQNTKSDIGLCPNKHLDSFKEQFSADPDHEYYKWIYEEEFIEKLQRLIAIVERRIRRGNERILGPDEQQMEREREKKLDVMRADVSALLKLAEEAGETGNIAAAEAHTAKANELRRNIDTIAGTPVKQISAQEKSLRVCEVCGAMQSTGDAASRFESHIAGKQHVGYELIRSTLATLKEKHANGVAPRLKSERIGSSRRDRSDSEDKVSDVPTAEIERPSDSASGDSHHRSRDHSRSRRRSRSRGPSKERNRRSYSPRTSRKYQQRRYHRSNDHDRYYHRKDYDRKDIKHDGHDSGHRRSHHHYNNSRDRSRSYDRGFRDAYDKEESLKYYRRSSSRDRYAECRSNQQQQSREECNDSSKEYFYRTTDRTATKTALAAVDTPSSNKILVNKNGINNEE